MLEQTSPSLIQTAEGLIELWGLAALASVQMERLDLWEAVCTMRVWLKFAGMGGGALSVIKDGMISVLQYYAKSKGLEQVML